ncbi:unnamed protein product [Heligmosomoides polygyrus]|uniref:TM2 domain-containing protein n=1 Tax=Heligmosomoides polygyrus TaxID=6339 RepID=A0A183GJQ5_HELPZ|nr:unnamed protein product [Heligmosomoides polygyrus]
MLTSGSGSYSTTSNTLIIHLSLNCSLMVILFWSAFQKPNSCSYHAHLHHSTALLLSIFLGFLGIDRIYLGYYAIGIIKMFSLGGLFVLWLIDVVLIALQLLLPADGSGYIINYYGPRVSPLRFDGGTNYSMYTCIDCM